MWMNIDNTLVIGNEAYLSIIRPETHTFEKNTIFRMFHLPQAGNEYKKNTIKFELLLFYQLSELVTCTIAQYTPFLFLISLWIRIWQMEESRRMFYWTCICFIVNFNKFTAIIYKYTSSLGYCMNGWCVVWLNVGGFGIFMFFNNFISPEARRMTKRNGWNGKRVKMNRDRITLLGLKSINHIPLLTNENITAASAIKKKSHVFDCIVE